MSSDSELSDSDVELQNAFSEGRIKPGLNKLEQAPRNFANNVSGLKQMLEERKLKLPWIEILDCINKQAPLAPELAVKMISQEHKRENEKKNNKKLPQIPSAEDPVLNDFKRETMFYRQAQAAVIEVIPKLKAMGIPTKRPDDYFAEMAKSDDHMQKVRQHLLKKQDEQKKSERVKQLRQQKKEGKMLQIQTKLQRQQEKKEMLEQVKKVRKGMVKDTDFLDSKKSKAISRKALEKRKVKDKKFGFGGKKKGMKLNTRDSSADIGEFRNPRKSNKDRRQSYKTKGTKNSRPGKNKRIKMKSKGRK